MKDTRHQEQAASPPIYQIHPPEWLPKTSRSADLGFPGFHPPRPQSEEDLLTESSVKHGYVLPSAVPAENFSAQTAINEKLQSSDALEGLSELINEVFQRKHQDNAAIQSHSFRMPMRVTLNGPKRQTWFADLANPDIPLHKLGKNVPHGAKGHDLLDLLHSNSVTIPRAVWFLRVSGANETSGLRNKPSYNPLQYSVDWANIVVSYLKKQLSAIALPSVPRPGLNMKVSFKGTLSDPDDRARWVSRFTYSLKLLRPFYDEGLVDRRTFLVWLVQQLETCNLAQAGFLVRLVHEYLDGIAASRPLSRPIVGACLSKLTEIQSLNSPELLYDTQCVMKVVLQRICVALPDSLVSPLLWAKHFSLMDAVFKQTLDDSKDDTLNQSFHRSVRRCFTTVRARNEALLFRHARSPVSSEIDSIIADVKLLNSITHLTNMSTVPYFPDNALQNLALFSSKLDLLLNWSVTPLQFGDHRPFVAVTLIRQCRNKAAERANRRDANPPDEFVQDALFHWLDTSEVAGDPENVRAVTLLYGKLVKFEVFSYARYIQRLIARGEPGLSSSEGVEESRHRRYLRWIPMYSSTPSLQNQRKMTLYGIHAREIPEDLTEREIRKEIRAILPEVFKGTQTPEPTSLQELLDRCPRLAKATRYEQVRIFRHWLAPILQKIISSRPRDPSFLRTYCTVVELMAHTKCYRALSDMTISVLVNDPEDDLLTAALDTLQRFATILTSVDAIANAVNALFSAHQTMRKRLKSRPLMILLVTLDAGRHLSPTDRERLFRDMTEYTLALQGGHQHQDAMPATLPEIQLLATNSAPDGPSALATQLWLRYRSCADWAGKVWEATFAYLCQLPEMTLGSEGSRDLGNRFAIFLRHVDKQLPMGLNPHILKWLLGTGKTQIIALSSDAWAILVPVLVRLVVDGVVQTTTLLQAVVFPAWQAAAAATSHEGYRSNIPLYHAAMLLCRCLLLCDRQALANGGVASSNLFIMQRLYTHRKAVFRESHFLSLASAAISLVVVDSNEFTDRTFKDEAFAVRAELFKDRSFSRGAFLCFDKLKVLCEEEMRRLHEMDPSLSQNVLKAVGMIFGNSFVDFDVSHDIDLTCFSCPWKMAVASLQFQLELHQAGRIITAQQSSSKVVQQKLDTLFETISSATPDVIHLFAKIIRSSGLVVTERFIARGLDRILDFLRKLEPSHAEYLEIHTRARDFLQVIVFLRSCKLQTSPTIDSSETLSSIVKEVKRRIESANPQAEHFKIHVGLLLRTLHFALGCSFPWPPELLTTLSTLLLKLLVRVSEGSQPDYAICYSLLDSFYYTIDCMPPTDDPFSRYSDVPLLEVASSNVSHEMLRKLQALLPVLSTTDATSDLAVSSRSAAGDLAIGNNVTNRPWEWTESLGEPPQSLTARDWGGSKTVVPNTNSLSLLAFDAQSTGDVLVEELGTLNSTPCPIRDFVDNVATDSIYRRDWEASRLQNDRLIEPVARPDFYPRGSPVKGQSRASPVRGSSVQSRSSGQGSGSRQGSNKGDPIDVDAFSTSSQSDSPTKKVGQKRKLTVVSDDEIEIVSGPSTAEAPPPAKKPTQKPKGKKR